MPGLRLRPCSWTLPRATCPRERVHFEANQLHVKGFGCRPLVMLPRTSAAEAPTGADEPVRPRLSRGRSAPWMESRDH